MGQLWGSSLILLVIPAKAGIQLLAFACIQEAELPLAFSERVTFWHCDARRDN